MDPDPDPNAAPRLDTDVLVVGAGPTGLMLANQLARRGVRTWIIDRHAAPAVETRALGVQARTLEIYAKLGLAERALALGTVATGAQLWAGGRATARVPLGDAGAGKTAFPFILVLGQDANERLLGERLREGGIEVQWRSELVGLEPHADHVSATLRHDDGTTRTVTAAWVGGCDGAHSRVRELTAIGFPGAPYEHAFFVADVQATGHMLAGEVNAYLWRSGFHLFFPMRGRDRWRIVGIVPAGLRDDPLDIDAVMPSLRGAAGMNLAIQTCSWFSTYRIHHRAAARFRDRRCFLLGDAAHIHSPVGAQGMNTGLQDATNLAWKLALVVGCRAGQTLLDSYESERRPVALRLLATTDRAFRLIVADAWWAGMLRTRVLARMAALAMQSRRIQGLAFRVVSQIGIHYRGGPLATTLPGLPRDAPRAGDRFPWLRLAPRASAPAEDYFAAVDDLHLALIVVGQGAPPVEAFGAGELLRIHTVAALDRNDAELARAHIPQPSFWLLRPDGHIGLCGTRLDVAACVHWLREALRLSGDGATLG